MFIIATGGDDTLPIDRLIRLMLNIEKGWRMYEWGPGSTAAQNPKKDSDKSFISIEVPGKISGAPSSTWDIRPTTGVILYRPSADFDPNMLIDQIEERIAAYDAAGGPQEEAHLTIEMAAQVSLLQERRVEQSTRRESCKDDKTIDWGKHRTHPIRRIFHRKASYSEEIPFISAHAAFTWHIVPAEILANVCEVATGCDLNLLTASIFLDAALLPASEPLEPIRDPHMHVHDIFGIKPLPTSIEYFLISSLKTPRRSRYLDSKFIAVYVDDTEGAEAGGGGARGHFEIAPLRDMFSNMGIFNPPAVPHVPFEELELVSSSRCCRCGFPLWGDFYALQVPKIGPLRAPVCKWCIGVYPPELFITPLDESTPAPTVTSRHPLSIREAYARYPKYQGVLPLLGVPVRPVTITTRCFVNSKFLINEDVYVVFDDRGPSWIARFIDRPANPPYRILGEQIAARPSSRQNWKKYGKRYLCLDHPELRDYPVESVNFVLNVGRIDRRPHKDIVKKCSYHKRMHAHDPELVAEYGHVCRRPADD